MEKESLTKNLRTWIEIDTKAIDHNLALARKSLPKEVKIMAVVKSNAYGHGLFDFSTYISSLGPRSVSWIGVDSIVEGVALRKSGITTPILVFGHTLAQRFPEAIAHDISITVSNMTALEAVLVAPQSEQLRLHLKIDTGLHRQGFLPEEIPGLIKAITKHASKLNIEGLYTHFADAKRSEGIEYTKNQKKIFTDVQAQFLQVGIKPLTHVSASPGIIRFGSEGEDMVRLGAALYGIYPSEDMQIEFEKTYSLTPSLSWKTLITEIKKIPKGSAVGYNRSEVVTRDTVIGILPIGYWHGYPGSLSSKGLVMVQGKPAKVLGRISMDITTIDLTDCADVKIGDEVTLIDSNPGSFASARSVALNAGVSVHELLTRLNPKMKRIYQ